MFLKQFSAMLFVTFVSTNGFAASVWKVSSEQHMLYIGGTIHALTPEDYPLPKEYDQAFQAADKIVLETDMLAVKDHSFRQKLLAKMTYADGTTLSEVLRPSTYAALHTHLAKRNIAISMFASYKPALVAVTLSMIELQKLGFTHIGVDQFYANLASEQGKPQSWLETPEQQIAFLMKLGKPDENTMLEYALQDIQNMPKMLDILRKTWREGDMLGMEKVAITDFKSNYPDIYQDLLVTRNNNWLPLIEQMLQDPVLEFVMVGVLHLSGPDSVLIKLQDQGYKIEKL
jgi:uncharacterized protein YbaP (TraB family)